MDMGMECIIRLSSMAGHLGRDKARDSLHTVGHQVLPLPTVTRHQDQGHMVTRRARGRGRAHRVGVQRVLHLLDGFPVLLVCLSVIHTPRGLTRIPHMHTITIMGIDHVEAAVEREKGAALEITIGGKTSENRHWVHLLGLMVYHLNRRGIQALHHRRIGQEDRI